MKNKQITKELRAIRTAMGEVQREYDKRMAFIWDWIGNLIKDIEGDKK